MGDYNDPNVDNKDQQVDNQLPEQGQRQQETNYVPQYQQPDYQQNPYQQPNYQQNPYQQNPYQQNQYQQNQYQQNQYQQPNQNQYQNAYQPYQKKNNGMAIGALICGIVSFVFNCCFWYLSIPVGIAGIVLGIISIKNKHDGKPMAIVGIVLSSIAIVLAILLFVACSVITSNEGFWNEFYNELDIESYY